MMSETGRGGMMDADSSDDETRRLLIKWEEARRIFFFLGLLFYESFIACAQFIVALLTSMHVFHR